MPYHIKRLTKGQGATEQPVLGVGMAGFNTLERNLLEAALVRLSRGRPIWRLAPFGEADAWMINGEKSRIAGAATLKVLPGLPTERALTLKLPEVERVMAFSVPLAYSGLRPKYTVDIASDASVEAAFQQFETWLRPVRVRFVLGRQLIHLEKQLTQDVYHVMHKGNLLAVMDFRNWKIGIQPDAEPSQFDEATWEKRPAEAGNIPPNFTAVSVAQLRWTYAQRSEKDLLLPRYRTRPIYYCQAPGVPLGWLKDSHLLLLRELSIGPRNFNDLMHRTHLPSQQLARDLASLYLAGSLTTMPAKAALGTALHGRVTGFDTDKLTAVPFPDTDPRYATYPSPRPNSDLTAPASLGFN